MLIIECKNLPSGSISYHIQWFYYYWYFWYFMQDVQKLALLLPYRSVQGTPTHSWCIYLYNSNAPFYILYASNSDRNFASININSAMEWPCQMTRFFQIFISSTIQDGCQEWCWKIDATSPFDVPARRIYSVKNARWGWWCSGPCSDSTPLVAHRWY